MTAAAHHLKVTHTSMGFTRTQCTGCPDGFEVKAENGDRVVHKFPDILPAPEATRHVIAHVMGGAHPQMTDEDGQGADIASAAEMFGGLRGSEGAVKYLAEQIPGVTMEVHDLRNAKD